MSESYAKLASSLVHSTVWRESAEVRVVWITLLALADAHGDVQASIPGLADAARVTILQCEEALAKFSAPDRYSRTKTLEGRRILPIAGGWHIINYDLYRNLLNLDYRRERDRERQRRYREKRKVTDVTRDKCDNGDSHTLSHDVTESHATSAQAVSSKQRQKEEALTTLHDARFPEIAHRTAYQQVRARARNPAAFDAMLATLVTPIAGGPAYDWRTVGQAMLEMQTSEAAPTAAAIRAYCRRLAAPLDRKGGATGDGIDWSQPIEDTPVFGPR